MESDASLIAYCGLYCGDCHGFDGRVPDLARDLRKELRKHRYDKFAEFISKYSFGKDFKGYADCYRVLGAMVRFRCRKGCKSGGGSPFCKIRVCAQKKDLEGCWECVDFEGCKKLDFLIPVHGDAHKKNLRKLKRKGVDSFLEGKKFWYSEIKK